MRDSGSVYRWGVDDYLQLGDPTLQAAASGTPVRAGKIDDAVAVSVGHMQRFTPSVVVAPE